MFVLTTTADRGPLHHDKKPRRPLFYSSSESLRSIVGPCGVVFDTFSSFSREGMQSGFTATALLVLLTKSASFMLCSPVRKQLVARSMSTTSSDIAQCLAKTEANESLVCIAIAGGDSHAIATLTATPGAWALLLEGTLTYDRHSFHSYVQYVPASEDNKFKYVSSEAAHLLLKMALARALCYHPKEQSQCIGVGSFEVSLINAVKPALELTTVSE